MTQYYFRSTRQPSVRAVTTDKEGLRLPSDLAPWELRSQGLLQTALSGEPLKPLQSGPMFDAIQENGFFILPTEMQDVEFDE